MRKIATAGEVLAGAGRSVLETLMDERQAVVEGQVPGPSELGQEVASLAAVLRAYLVRLSPENATAWAVTILETRPPRGRSEPHEADADGRPIPSWAWAPHYTHRETEQVCQDYVRHLRREDWPVLSDVLGGLRARRVEQVRRADQDLSRLALPAKTSLTEEEAEAKAAQARAWRTVTEDVLTGLIRGAEEAEAEAARRVTMGEDEISTRRLALRTSQGRRLGMVAKGGGR